MRAFAIAAALAATAGVAHADDVLHPGTPSLDPPTLTALGVVLPITGDDDFNATVTVRYRVTGTTDWHDAMPLQHVHAEAVTGETVTPQFAGSILGLAPATSYDVELHAVDADGAVDQTLTLTGTTRPVPGDPAHPHAVAVTDAASLQAALDAAQPGDVITLADGTYAGAFGIHASGTAADPIVIRGTSRDGTILDGQGCAACNVLELYGSYLHVEHLTLQHANRALRFQTAGAQGGVVRRTHIRDVTLAIGSNPDQQDFYIADNLVEGRLVWPCVYTSDDPACNAGGQHGLHANDDGIHVEGNGHVISHNTISGFGDAMKVEEDGAVSVDFVGNDVLWTYDNGVELDGSARNTRALRNRFTNTFATLSFQPIFGGPSYAIGNELVNVADEQFKLHARGTTPTVGAVILHNTVVRATRALQCSTADAPLWFTVEDNLFVGPDVLDPDGHAVRWDVPSVSTATLDWNGFYPDGQYEYGYGSGGTTYPSFAALVASGTFEQHSTLVTSATFDGGAVGPADWTVTLPPSTPLLAAASPARGAATPIANVDSAGATADLGAIPYGCAAPTYGVRPPGIDESNEPTGCAGPGGGDGGGIPDNPDAGTAGGGAKAGGCCQTGGSPGGSLVLVALVALAATVRCRSSRARASRRP